MRSSQDSVSSSTVETTSRDTPPPAHWNIARIGDMDSIAVSRFAPRREPQRCGAALPRQDFGFPDESRPIPACLEVRPSGRRFTMNRSTRRASRSMAIGVAC